MPDELNPYAAPAADTNQIEQPPSKRTGWKVYALSVLVLQGVGLISGLPEMDTVQAVDFGMTTMGVVGLLGFAFRRRLLVCWVWMAWSILLPLWDTAMGIWVYPSQEAQPKPGWTTAYFMAMALFVPEYLALLWYAYRSREIWRR